MPKRKILEKNTKYWRCHSRTQSQYSADIFGTLNKMFRHSKFKHSIDSVTLDYLKHHLEPRDVNFFFEPEMAVWTSLLEKNAITSASWYERKLTAKENVKKTGENASIPFTRFFYKYDPLPNVFVKRNPHKKIVTGVQKATCVFPPKPTGGKWFPANPPGGKLLCAAAKSIDATTDMGTPFGFATVDYPGAE